MVGIKMARWNRKLPPLQRQIVLLLGKEGALTKNEVSEKLNKSYKNVIFAFKSLEAKNLIEKIEEEKIYRNRKFDQFWLTLKGVIEAYAAGAPLELLKKNTEKILKAKNEHIDILFDLLEAFGKKKAYQLLDMIDFSGGKPRLVSINLNFTNEREARKILRVVKKYKFYREKTIKTLKSVMEELL